MSAFSPVPTMFVPFGCLGASIAGLWVSENLLLWSAMAVISVTLALLYGIVNAAGIAFVVAAAAGIYAFFRIPAGRGVHIVLGIVMCALTLGLYAHFFPGYARLYAAPVVED